MYSQDLKTTTTTADAPSHENRQEIDTSPLAAIGFTGAHATQICNRGKITPAELQDSIEYFAFDLEKNNKAQTISGSPLNFFMGILGKGRCYTAPENYESPEAVARRVYLDFKRSEAARKKADEEELFEIEFSDWLKSLSFAERQNLAPLAKTDGSELQRSSLRIAFKEMQSVRTQIESSLPFSPNARPANTPLRSPT